MKKVYVADNAMEAHLVKGVLENEGIPCIVENENLVTAWGDIPPNIDTLPAVSVLDDAQAPEAERIVKEFLAARKKRDPDAEESPDSPARPAFIVTALLILGIVILVAMIVMFF